MVRGSLSYCLCPPLDFQGQHREYLPQLARILPSLAGPYILLALDSFAYKSDTHTRAHIHTTVFICCYITTPKHTVAENNNKHLLSHCLCGSDIWKQFNRVVLAWSLFEDCSQVSAGTAVGEGLMSLLQSSSIQPGSSAGLASPWPCTGLPEGPPSMVATFLRSEQSKGVRRKAQYPL